jgi:predicted permease
MLTDLLYRLRAMFHRDRLDMELEEELRSHLDRETEKYLRAGVPEEEAKRRARLALGGIQQVIEECRDSRGVSTVTTMWQDIQYGLRVLRKSPAMTCVAIGSLALGIGANTIAFSVVNALILRPLPFPSPEQLVSIQPGAGTTSSFPNYRDLRDRNNAFSGVAGYRITVLGLDTGESSQRIWGYLSTGNYFEVLGAKPLLGRFFGPAEDRQRGGSPYAVLSYGCWRQRFGGDTGIVGRTIRLNGLAYTVLGVASNGFQGTELFYWPEVWVPMSMQAQIESFSWLDERSTFNTMVIGRLKDGITRQEAEARLEPIAAALAKEHPRWNEGLRFRLTQPGLAGDAGRGPVAAFTAGVLLLAGLVLLAACVNLATLLAARTADRHKELAVRMSLGAGRGRIARQLITESVLLSCGGGLAAWGLAVLLLRLLSQWRAPLDFPVQFNVAPDWRVFLFTCLISILSGLLFGLVPAQRAWSTDPNPALKGMPAGSPGKWALRDLLLPVQVALCCLLVMTSLVSLRGLQRALETPLGFKPEGVAVAGFDLGLSRYQKPQGQAFQRAILDAVAGMPGVSMAAIANSVPLSIDQSFNSVAPEEATDFRPSARINVAAYQVSPGYFRTMGTALLSGREFSWQDDESAPRVAIINATLARKLFGQTHVVGRRFRTGGGAGFIEVIGVAEDGKYVNLTEEPRPALFKSAMQAYNGTTVLIARTSMPESQTAAEIRRALASREATIAVYGVGSLSQMLGFAYFPARAATIALGVFGILAIMLAATGIYGMAAYATSRRRREIGIRMAIGAQPRQILRVVLGRTCALLSAGSIAGFLLGLGAGPLLASVVYQASPHDPLVLISVPLTMAVIGFFAALGPAGRALRIDPLPALRQD